MVKMWSSRVFIGVTISVIALQVQPCCAQNVIHPFLNGFASAISSSIFGRIDTDIPFEFGREVRISKVPYQIALYKNNYFICSGAIISADWVLTAADCVDDGGIFGIRAGSSNNAEGGQIRLISTIVINEGYNSKSKENDIAMLRVGQPFVWSRFCQPVDLAGPRSKVPRHLLVTGWGSINDYIADSVYQLRGIEVTSVAHETCRYAYMNTISISQNVLCATAPVENACQADSGSPLAYQGALYGLQSFGAGCIRYDIPGIYTNVRRHLRWIKTVTKRFGGETVSFQF